MSYDDTAKQLRELLQDKDNAVVALSGAWGTGKTVLWQSIEKQLTQERRWHATPLYIPLFGVRSVEEVQSQIIQAALLSNDPNVRETLKSSYSLITNAAGLLGFGWAKNVIE